MTKLVMYFLLWFEVKHPAISPLVFLFSGEKAIMARIIDILFAEYFELCGHLYILQVPLLLLNNIPVSGQLYFEKNNVINVAM